jgi:predicted short-subunit dehydrogenase-like oxidoreductase (DUF2520 family)
MKVILIGAGNLATQLGLALKAAGHDILQVYSRTQTSAQSLAKALEGSPVTRPEDVLPDAELYICALKDDVLLQILPYINVGQGLVVHTAGSLPMSLLASCTDNYGVFYPLQTFSKQRKSDFGEMYIFIEAVKPESLGVLRALGQQLGSKMVEADSAQRQQLHVSAVFSCNFVNYLYSIADDLMKEKGLDFQYLLPLIRETALKVETLSPDEAQTGPAVRFDRKVMDKHLDQLNDHPDWQTLYEKLSEGIHQRVKQHFK